MLDEEQELFLHDSAAAPGAAFGLCALSFVADQGPTLFPPSGTPMDPGLIMDILV